eukprot:243664-Prorocentrum_lima.AAC.1
MTSSLVGSEMCIRDRMSGGALWCGGRCGGAGGCGRVPVTARRWRAAGAVSYTHLTLPRICSV